MRFLGALEHCATSNLKSVLHSSVRLQKVERSIFAIGHKHSVTHSASRAGINE
jgi:hypothetical protein